MTERKRRRPSTHFEQARVRSLARERVRSQRRQYEQKRPEQIGVYAGGGEIVVNGHRYPFRDTQNINPVIGQSLVVRNVGRPAVVIMAPSEGTEVR